MADHRFYPPRGFAGLPPEFTAFDSARVVVLPIPYDSTTTARAGARAGPRAIIDASEDMELYDLALGREPYRLGIHTLPDLAVHAGSPEAMLRRVEDVVGELLEGGKFVVTLGGEHTMAVGALRAHVRRWNDLSVLAVDAHADLREEYLDTPYNHACTLRRILEALAPGDGEPLVQVGLRSASAEEAAFIRERRLPFYSPRALREAGPDRLVAALRASVYVTIDLDGLDPSQMAAVGTPEPGGLLWDEVSDLLTALAGQKRIVGFDVTELAPRLGPEACGQAAAKLAYRLMGLALGPQD